ncbi:upf0489 protein c5orf22 [Plakobranchus ocellatus]|uniref:Upf0489 protein c5orf22 n=1 Tax=Plakobranchus ocellatus TaxID=259542 RepID=A0AAV4C3D1_9GAST|nr:upf0489 protein c5orf22 [Plakobranchus ocellatus]
MSVSRLSFVRKWTRSCCLALAFVSICLLLMSSRFTDHLFGQSAAFLSQKQADVTTRSQSLNTINMSLNENDIGDGVFLPVYVFEEHHEAIQYWFSAVQSGLLPRRSKNTLIHIDAHADLVSPNFMEGFPLYKWPRFYEISRLMTANDRFILAATATGLFSRIVWIWPSWDRTSILKEVHGESFALNVTIGFLRRPQVLPTGKGIGQRGYKSKFTAHYQISDLCYCIVALNPTSHWKKMTRGKPCFIYSTSLLQGNPTKTECTEKTSLLVDVYSEDEILRASKPEGHFKPISANHGFILDIDEDFFGCEAAVQPLYDVGLNETFIRRISFWVEKLFCGRTAEHELASDFFFYNVIQYIKNNRNICSNLKKTTDPHKILVNHCFVNMYHNLHKILRSKLASMDTEFVDSIFCKSSNDAFYKSILYQLLVLLTSLESNQLTALENVGICFESSQNTYGDSRVGHFHLCDGYNRPNDTVVTFFTPSDKEIKYRMNNLQTFLGQLARSPNLVTLCRSVRDGYTPRSRFRQIEDMVIEIIRNRYNKSRYYVHEFYDRDLLGGKEGWWQRNRE